MLWTILMALLSLWFLGVESGIGGSLIHVLLAMAALVLIFNFLGKRRVEA